MGERLQVVTDKQGNRGYFSPKSNRVYSSVEEATSDLKRMSTEPLERAVESAQTLRAATPIEKADYYLGALNPLRLFRPGSTTMGAAGAMAAATPTAIATGNPYSGAAILAAAGLGGGMAANLSAQMAQRGAPGVLGSPSDTPVQTAAEETLFDRIVSAIPGLAETYRDPLKKKLLTIIAPNKRTAEEKAALEWAIKEHGMNFDTAQTTGSKGAEILESLTGHKQATALRTAQEREIGKIVDKQISGAYNSSGNPNLRPNVGMETRPGLFAEKAGMPYREFENVLNIGNPDPNILDSYLAKISGKGMNINTTQAYLAKMAGQSGIPYEKMMGYTKARFLQKAFESASKNSPKGDFTVWSGSTLQDILDTNRYTVKKLFSSDERASLNHLAHVMKIVDPELPLTGKVALGIRAAGAGLMLGGGVIDALTGQNFGRGAQTGAIMLTAIGGAAPLIRRLMLNPRNAKLAGDLMLTPYDNKYVLNKTKNLLRGLKGMQFMVQDAVNGANIAPVEVQPDGSLKVREGN